jgi:hypothetical protein
MKILIPSLLLIIFFSSLVCASIFTAESAVMNIEIKNKLNIIPESSNAVIDELRVILNHYPVEEDYQRIMHFTTIPDAYEEDDQLIFEWNNPKSNQLSFSISSRLQNSHNFITVKKTIPYPLPSIPSEARKYTQPSEKIDSNHPSIVEKASELTQGEDDLYVIVYKLANFVESNITYSLDTLTAETNQKASWVLKNKIGVCDELTNLFIAMARSVGIPAKFISGVAYTDYNNIDDWMPHAWAEVYFPGYGWIPYDITYREFGYIDASHIKLGEQVDSAKLTTKYEWIGRDVDIETDSLQIEANAISLEGNFNPNIDIELATAKDITGIGSYNLLIADIINNNDHYTLTDLILSETDSLTILGKIKQNIILLPNERKRLYWIMKVDNDLDRGYWYTFPISMKIIGNITTSTYFEVHPRAEKYSFDTMKKLMPQTEEKEKKIVQTIDFNCIRPAYLIINDEFDIKCKLKNIGNTIQSNIDVCLENNCQEISLGINQEETITIPTIITKPGIKELKINAINKQIQESQLIQIEAFDTPKLSISQLDYPKNIEYEKDFKIRCQIQKDSYIEVENITIKIGPPIYIYESF